MAASSDDMSLLKQCISSKLIARSVRGNYRIVIALPSYLKVCTV
jgi:hypothetical protein